MSKKPRQNSPSSPSTGGDIRTSDLKGIPLPPMPTAEEILTGDGPGNVSVSPDTGAVSPDNVTISETTTASSPEITTTPTLPPVEPPAAPQGAESVSVPVDVLSGLVSELKELRSLRSTVKELQQAMAEMAAVTKTSMAPPPRYDDLRDDMMYVRIKPYNERRGYRRMRQYVDELSRVAIGGTGLPGDVPIWYEVDPDTAEALRRYRQKPSDPGSPGVFDIATAEQRRHIDRQEDLWRRSHMGFGMPPEAVAKQGRAITQRAGRTLPPKAAPAVQKEEPAATDGAKAFKESLGGRGAALAGLDDESASSYQDISDLGREDITQELDSAIKFAEKNPMKGGRGRPKFNDRGQPVDDYGRVIP